MLLTADLHLTDQPEDEYRWAVFAALRAELSKVDSDVYILGDLCDRKDRHSATLVNRLVTELTALRDAIAPYEIHIIMGNHDQPLKGEPFWSFLSLLDGVHFHTQPTELNNDLLLLPFTSNPREAWADIDLEAYRGIFLHQPVDGARGENGMAISGSPMPALPPSCAVYAGDIHVPQEVRGLTYVGAPHPIKFGDSYPCRLLRLDHRFRIVKEAILDPARKTMLDMRAETEAQLISELREGFNRRDVVKVRYHLPLDIIDTWPRIKARVTHEIAKRGVALRGIEAIVEMTRAAGRTATEMLEAQHPEEVLRSFGETEALSKAVLDVGMTYLRAVAALGSR